MSISLSAVPQQNPYYRTQNTIGAVNQTAAQSSAAANPGQAVGKTGTSSQSSEVKAKSDPDTVCQTCKRRRYQDQSNDPGVSFKSPGYINPNASASVVMSHEQEHVTREQAKAGEEGKRVVSQTVVLQYAVCPECHKVYVSGGETRTVTAAAGTDRQSGQASGKILDVRV